MRLYEKFSQKPMIELSDVVKREDEAAEKCHILLKEFNNPKNKKVRDHCYDTGLYRGAAHNNRNQKYRIPDYIPTAFHNLSSYDTHFFIKELGRRFKKNDIGINAENKEKYISFNVKIKVKLAEATNKDGTEACKNIHLRFTDRFRFMASGLDKLASNLDNDQCKHLKEFYKKEEVKPL